MIEKNAIVPKEAPFLASSMTAEDVSAHVSLVKDAMTKAMVKGEDFGTIPGCDKPTLFKPGAEKLCVLFRLAPSFETVEHFDGNHLTVRSKCTLTHINSGRPIAQGDAICSTKEKKYAKRKLNGKVVDNQELPDCYNTVLKMADKRALVAAALVATAASSIFTQDMGDDEKPEEKEPVEAQATVKEPPKEQGLTDEKVWVGRIVGAEPRVDGSNKFTLIEGEDGTKFLLVQPPESNKARLDLYTMICKDLQESKAKGEELSITYAISAKKNNLIHSIKAAEPSVLA